MRSIKLKLPVLLKVSVRKLLFRFKRDFYKAAQDAVAGVEGFFFFSQLFFTKECKPEELIVLILDSEQYPYNIIKKEGSYPTWVSKLKQEGIEYYYYYGGKIKDFILKDNIKLSCPDNDYTQKFISSLRLLDYSDSIDKYVVRTNSSSFWRIKYLRKVITYLKTNDIDYFGVRGYDYSLKINFASGAGFILSPKAIEFLLEGNESINYSLIDDVALGNFFKKKAINFKKGFRLDLTRSNWQSKALLFGFFHYHFRCKTKTLEKEKRKEDIHKMLFLNRLFPN